MSPELETKLFGAYPELFRDRLLGYDKTRIQHIECGDGWYTLINAMCAELQLRAPEVVFFQIKEKFGALRVYLLPTSDNAAKAIIDKYEFESRSICEICGKPAKIQNINWVYKAVCDDHYEELSCNA